MERMRAHCYLSWKTCALVALTKTALFALCASLMPLVCSCVLYKARLFPRVMLCDDKFFDGDTFGQQLENAFDDFKAFLRAKKINCSQKMFTPRFAPWKTI